MNTQNFLLIAMMLVAYFFILLPQIRRNKKQNQFRASLKKGDKIVTTGGVHGKITEVKDTTVLIDAGGGVKLKVDRTALTMAAADVAKKESE